MARYRKSYEEQLNALDEHIARTQEKLNNLHEQKEILLAKKREDEISELYQIMRENELSAEDVLNMIREQEQRTA